MVNPPAGCLCNTSLLVEGQKAPCLVVQLTEVFKNKSVIGADTFGEVKCCIDPSIWGEHSFSEGSVLILSNVTILPGPVVLVTERNIVDYIPI